MLNLEGHLCSTAVIDRDVQWRGHGRLRNRHELKLDKIDQAFELPEWPCVDVVMFRLVVLRYIN